MLDECSLRKGKGYTVYWGVFEEVTVEKMSIISIWSHCLHCVHCFTVTQLISLHFKCKCTGFSIMKAVWISLVLFSSYCSMILNTGLCILQNCDYCHACFGDFWLTYCILLFKFNSHHCLGFWVSHCYFCGVKGLLLDPLHTWFQGESEQIWLLDGYSPVAWLKPTNHLDCTFLEVEQAQLNWSI